MCTLAPLQHSNKGARLKCVVLPFPARKQLPAWVAPKLCRCNLQSLQVLFNRRAIPFQEHPDVYTNANLVVQESRKWA